MIYELSGFLAWLFFVRPQYYYLNLFLIIIF